MVHPSLEETFGNILIEAMACKCLPIGGIDSGAVPYVLQHGKLGVLCDVRSPKAIFNAMQTVYNSPMEEMRQLGYENVRTMYSPDSVCGQYLRLFSNIINKTIDG